MSTKSNAESGHIVNFENFGKLTSEVKGFGTDGTAGAAPAPSPYQPTEPDLMIPALDAKYAAAERRIKAVDDALGVWNVTVNERQNGYEDMDTLAHRAIGHMASKDLNAKIIKDLKSQLKKIRGERVKKIKKGTDPGEKRKISAAQTSFVKKLDHFKKLVGLLRASRTYNPNEADIKIEALDGYMERLKTLNKAVNDDAQKVFEARLERDKELYRERVGLVDVALRVKEYVKGMLPSGASSAEYKRVRHINFRDILLGKKESKGGASV